MSKEIRERKKRKQLNKVARKSKAKSTNKVGITVTNVDVLKIDFKDMTIITVAMIPFFIALSCVLGIKTLDFKILSGMSYGFTLTPILASFVLVPVAYLGMFYLKNKDAVNKRHFFSVFLGIISGELLLISLGSYIKELVLFNVPSYLLIVLFAIVVIAYYVIKINKLVKLRRVRR